MKYKKTVFSNIKNTLRREEDWYPILLFPVFLIATIYYNVIYTLIFYIVFSCFFIYLSISLNDGKGGVLRASALSLFRFFKFSIYLFFLASMFSLIFSFMASFLNIYVFSFSLSIYLYLQSFFNGGSAFLTIFADRNEILYLL